MTDSRREETVWLSIESRLLQLHGRSSALSNLEDPTGGTGEVGGLRPDVAARIVAASAEIIEDVGEVSRQNMLLVEEVLTSVRALRRTHQVVADQPKLPLHRRASPAQLVVLALALVVGVFFTSYLVGHVRGFPEGCARGIHDAMAQRAV